MDFENEEIFNDEITNEFGETSEYSEREQLEKLIEEATRRLESLNEQNEYNGDMEIASFSKYSDEELVDTMVIKDATERLMSFDEREVYNSPQVCSEIAELASSIKDAADRLNSNNGKFGGVNFGKYSDEDLINTNVIKAATEELAFFNNEEVYNSPEVCSEIAELATTIKNATDRLSKNVQNFIPYNQSEDIWE